MLSLDPSPERRPKALRNIRIAAAVVFLCALVLSTRGFRGDPDADIACAAVGGLALAVYGVATLLDDTATFPKWLYAGIAVLGASLAVFHAVSLFT